ncbi:tRNA pseudouridine(55) synthase TruB [Cellulomonas fimi]|uniref:tRNA pseudouridine synthase B n=1 Tax=Cellulomonas fimi (strain ATCC 484 / DSM 20113 / JCM 1341 / CCUG 24087 / LMG 16345 / NBRC 15513 / NCIMB 8980 / NCTC 7547 / NRS-133) TaxID=590998 RepID=F4H736_CELFA|nr:tRNA pseudouridine(55) synthase TruB [Cellulomonas fimi]AEE45670.1 tRNA pseudouridine synthase B [Cellulomonas fimi ATCC 484]NNH07413.1 tRNA pseudouridine(55) synthase TruB [Cellulomonas fimi]VEH30241.1 tRNA pseudouridine synthase B [Cellulomonas fimi]
MTREQRPGPRRPTAADGLLVVDKPQGWTSHDVVARTRRLAATRKVGHAGTLDPMATGVLVLGIGRATRLLTYVVGADKEYTATVRLGVATTTDDAEGEVVAVRDASGVSDAGLAAAVAALTGPILQVPSSVSAIKVAGERAYARVRAGEQVELAARPVTVSRFDVHGRRRAVVDGTAVLDVDVTVVCSSGTYVRALARDVGAALGVGGHLTALRRTRVGGFGLDVARTLEQLAAEPEDAPLPVLPLSDAARATFPVRDLAEPEVRALSYGQALAPVDGGPAGTVAAIAPDGTLVALVEDRGGRVRPVLVFAPATA